MRIHRGHTAHERRRNTTAIGMRCSIILTISTENVWSAAGLQGGSLVQKTSLRNVFGHLISLHAGSWKMSAAVDYNGPWYE